MEHNTAQQRSLGLTEFLEYCRHSPEPLGVEELSALLSALELGVDEVAEFVKFDPELYCRSSIQRTPVAEVLVMCWSSGQLSPIHDHAGSACGIRVLQGRATEIAYGHTASGLLVPARTSHIERGEVAVSFDREIHQLGNLEAVDAPLVTLHCYSPPLRGMNLFDGGSSYFSGYERTFAACTQRIEYRTVKNDSAH